VTDDNKPLSNEPPKALTGKWETVALWRTGTAALYTKTVELNDSRHLLMRSLFWRVAMLRAE
jgi:hypothetical protein